MDRHDDGGYDAAVKDARESSHATIIADVKADTKYTNVLFGIYQRQCTAVTGRVAGVTVPDSGAQGLTVLQAGVGWGDGGLARAMAKAEQDAGGDVLVDVRADRHFSTVLWIYRRDCVEIHASVAPPLASR